MPDILDNLVSGGHVQQEQADSIRALHRAGKPLDEAFLAALNLPEDAVLKLMAQAFGVRYVEIEQSCPSREFLQQFPARILLEHKLLPLQDDNGHTLVATCRLFDTAGLDQLRLVTNRNLRPVLSPSAEIDRCLKRFLGVGADTVQSLVSEAASSGVQVIDGGDGGVDLTAAAEDASIIRFVNQLLTEAIELRATDVHVEPFENELRVRYRVDGVLQEAATPPEVRRFQAAIVSRLKIISQLDIAEKRLPQDGRIKLRIAGREIDVRVSVIPMIHGEAVVLRLLDRGAAMLGIEHLGMAPEDHKAFETLLDLPHGIILVTGPTGSGKTTTLYAGLARINDVQRKIITIEDPVEYQLRGVNQIQVSAKAGLTFSTGLRSILRHDPDVVLVGEIRDRETAEIAVQASLTGHLVFSTLHTNDAPGAVTRLVDMGIEPYLVASSLEAVLAQRLVRVICETCKQSASPAEIAATSAAYASRMPPVIYRGEGCRACMGTGYRGRRGIFEVMPVTPGVRQRILLNASAGQIREEALRTGMRSLRDDGWRLIGAGVTTIEEVLRVTKDETVAGEAFLAGNGLPHTPLAADEGAAT